MPFMPKSNRQANFLKALKGDQTKGLPPVAGPMAAPMAGGMKSPMAPPMANPPPVSMNPQQNPRPAPMIHIPQAPMPNLKPIGAPVNPIAAPGLPSGSKLPKFGKMRNSLKGGPFKK